MSRLSAALKTALVALFLTLSPLAASATTIYLTSGTSWTVPSDFNASANSISVIGGGGGGAGGSTGWLDRGGGGGGGGGYAKAFNLNLTPGASVVIAVGAGGGAGGANTNGAVGGYTGVRDLANSAWVVRAPPGGGGYADATRGLGGAASGGIGAIKYAGGAGGTAGAWGWSTGLGGGGGGGAAGKNGAGLAAMPNNSSGDGGTGGKGDNGTGGAGGAGGLNVSGAGSPGSAGTEFGSSYGAGGGGGGSGGINSSTSGAGGLYGGGGAGGAGYYDGRGGGPGGAGAPGLIVVDYTPTGGGGGAGGATTVYLLSGSYWTVPADFNAAANTIEAIGGGGGGALPSPGSPYPPMPGGGGGGGYSKITNLYLAPATSIPYNVGDGGGGQANTSSGGPGGNAGDSWFNSTGTLLARAGQGGTQSNTTPSPFTGGAGGQASAGVGTTKYSGGNGGPSGSPARYGAGGGAAGPAGAGGAGGNGGDYGGNWFSGGGGGGGAGSGGGAGAGADAASGVNGDLSGAGGAGATGGGAGGKGGRWDAGAPGPNGQHGMPGTVWGGTYGPGGGGGGSARGANSEGGDGGLFGAGGGSGSGSGTGYGGNGAQGLIVITYTPATSGLTYPSLPPGPIGRNLDARGVDLASGQLKMEVASVTIGVPGQGGLAYDHGMGWGGGSAPFGALNKSGSLYTVTLGGLSETFTLTGTDATGTFTQNQGRPSSMSYNSSADRYYYTLTDGTVAVFDHAKTGVSPLQANQGLLVMITRPDGEVINYSYKSYQRPDSLWVHRIRSIGNNLGYQIHFDYEAQDNSVASLMLAKVTALNRAVEYCNPDGDNCTFTQAWPTLTFSNEGRVITDALGQTVEVATNAAVTTVTRSGGRLAMAYTVDSLGRITAVSNGEATWTYTYSMFDADTFQTIATDPLGKTKTIKTYLPSVSLEENSQRKMTFEFDSATRPRYAHLPSGQGIYYTYDGRGNVFQTTRFSSLPDSWPHVGLTDYYPSSCSNPKTCNKPYQRVNGRGHSTEYTYNPNNGAVDTMTLPPDAGSNRASWTYNYQQLYAQYKDASGTLVAAGTPVWRIERSMHCNSPTAGCLGTGHPDEIKVMYNYGGSNNLQPTIVADSTGDNTAQVIKATTYNTYGDVTSVDGPVTGTSDTTVTRYDVLRRAVGTVAPPFTNNLGQVRHRARRIVYDAAGAIALIELGVVTGYDDTAWANFASLQQTKVEYDAVGRKVREMTTAGGTTYTVTQYAYNLRGEVICVAKRRNPAAFNALPDACQLGAQGDAGPDRITRYTYDDDGRVLTVKGGAETGGAADVTNTYGSDGLLSTVADAKGQVSQYLWDGHNRLRGLQYPHPSTGAVNTGDAEYFSYDSNDNRTYVSTRESNLLTYGYDAADQMVSSTVPSRTYQYDMSGRVVTSNDAGYGALNTTYNALGWVMSRGGTYGASYQYDAAGRRTRMTWPDGFYVTYEYDAASNLTAIKEGGSTTLVTFSYDDFGRRAKQTYFNGRYADYSYDPASRLTKLNYAFWPRWLDFTYDDAGRIKTRDSNTPSDLFWNGHYSVDRGYTINGLNQATTSGSNTLTYDQRGNLQTDGTGTTTYYDQLNRLSSDTAGASLIYDPLDRLHSVSKSGATTKFAYDGVNVIGEYDASNNVLRRYVYGPGVDEPMIWYEGAGTGLTSKRTLLPDERGSIVVVSEHDGNTLAINRYDDYGLNASNHLGRFGYTGQMWLPELGLYYYKARLYSPTLGRFLQADPSRYKAGTNMYAYVRGDPINYRDSSGREPARITTPPTNVSEVVVTASPKGGQIERWSGTPLNEFCYYCGTEDNGIWLDPNPDQSTNKSCTLASGQVNVHITGHPPTIEISGKIAFPQGGAAEYLGALNGRWSGTYGGYNFITNMTEGEYGLVAEAVLPVDGRPSAQIGGPHMTLNSLSGATPTQIGNSLMYAAHEFGHILGLADQYTMDVYNIPQPYSGMENDIMADASKDPSPFSVNTIIDACQ